jgi:hypothetical protein
MRVELKALGRSSASRFGRKCSNTRGPGRCRRIVVPIRKRDDGIVCGKISAEGTFPLEAYPTIVNIVQMLLGIIWIVDNQGSAQAITILVPEVTVVPVCPLK